MTAKHTSVLAAGRLPASGVRCQAKDYLLKALAEFQRLELRHKEQEAKEVLKRLA